MEHVLMVNKQELDELIDERVNAAIIKFNESGTKKDSPHPTFIFGIKGLAAFLNVSMPTAQRYKNAKLFPCIQRGRKIIFKSDEVIAGLAKKRRI